MITAFGETKNINEWAEIVSMPAERIRQRIKRLGWTAEKALTVKKYKSWGL